jgi:hypothetical protein
MSQCEHAGTIEERVEAKNVLTGLVGNDFQFTVTTVEQVVLDGRAGIAHGLPTVSDAHRSRRRCARAAGVGRNDCDQQG